MNLILNKYQANGCPQLIDDCYISNEELKCVGKKCIFKEIEVNNTFR